jgi:Zinc finger, C2H2 type/C2H2-type zinc finger
MSSKFIFNVCRVCFAPDCVVNLSSLFEENAENAEKFRNVTRIDVRLQCFGRISNFPSILICSQISADQGKHDAMICERCLKELNAAFEFAERSRSAEKLYFAKFREEFDQQKQQEPDEMEETEVKAQHEEGRIKREPSIEIETVEIDMNDYSDISDEGEANEASYCEDDKKDEDKGEVEESHPMFAFQAATESLSKLKEVPVSTNAKKKRSRTKKQCPICNKTLTSKYALQYHIEMVHEKKTRFSCPHCPKAFYRKDDLQRHIAQCHTFTNDDTTNSNRPFECDIDNCGKFFKTKGDLKIHQQRVHSGEFSFLQSKKSIWFEF